jgi:hypothetical protein
MNLQKYIYSFSLLQISDIYKFKVSLKLLQVKEIFDLL